MAKYTLAILVLALINASAVLSVKLYTSDGEIFDTTFEIAKCSGTIKHLLEDCDISEDDENFLPLPEVSSNILPLILKWAEHHKDDEPTEIQADKKKRTDDISKWDAEFLKVDQSTLFELIKAANYLEIPNLVDVACKTVANMIKGKSPEQIRETFHIKDGFSADEEAQINKEKKMFQ